MRIGDCLSIIRAISADIPEIGVREFGVEQVERCVACMQNKGLSWPGGGRLAEFERGGVSVGPAAREGGRQPLGTFGTLRNRCGDRLGRAFRRIFERHAFDMLLRCCVGHAFFASPANDEYMQGE